MKILKDDHPTLKQISQAVLPDEFSGLSEVIEKMTALMDAEHGIGLSAVQVGILKRFFIMRDPNTNEVHVCINPTIIELHSKPTKINEGCLSYPGLMLKVPRHDKIVVEYTLLNGRTNVDILEGLMSQCYQHELDHLNGITFNTRVSSLHLQLQSKKRAKYIKNNDIS